MGVWHSSFKFLGENLKVKNFKLHTILYHNNYINVSLFRCNQKKLTIYDIKNPSNHKGKT